MKSCLNLSKLRRKYCRYPFYGPSFVFQYGNTGGGDIGVHSSQVKNQNLGSAPPQPGACPTSPTKEPPIPAVVWRARVCSQSESTTAKTGSSVRLVTMTTSRRRNSPVTSRHRRRLVCRSVRLLLLTTAR